MTDETNGGTATVDDEIDAGGKLEVLDPTGHFEIRWGKKKSEVESAEATFNDLLSKGYRAFVKTWVGRKGKQATAFDPKAGVYLFAKTEKAASEADKTEDEFSHEQTKKFDKKAETTMVPPLRGG